MKAYLLSLMLGVFCFSAGADEIKLTPLRFGRLPYWHEDAHEDALAAFQRSCERIQQLAPDAIYGTGQLAVKASQWQFACEEARLVSPDDAVGARAFFERVFTPYQVAGTVKFTGYYEPLLRGSRVKKAGFETPVYGRPQDLQNGVVYPLTRAQIDAGALANKGLEKMWVNDPVDLFFLQVQGSGRVLMDTGETVSLRFDGKTNQPYTAIGKILVQRGELSQEAVSAPAIRHWLHTHTDEAQNVMHQNASYVFFDMSQDTPKTPYGAENVALSPERSLAVDQAVIPLGTPIFVQTTLPQTRFSQGEHYHHLMVAQDTGSAIRGAFRGDIFFGFGERAEELAGYMKSEGGWVLLLPSRVGRAMESKL